MAGPVGLVVAVLLLGTLLASPASAQLRTGRATRELYQDDLRRGTTSETSTPQTWESQARGGARLVTSQVVQAACTDCDSAPGTGFAQQDSFGDVYLADDGYGNVGHGNVGHGATCGCDDCGSFADIAPACMSMQCEPGCGPLMWLWQRMSVRAEVPLFWRRAAGPPPLVTTAPGGTASDIAGQLGQASTTTLLGDGPLNEDAQAGFRITLSTPLGQSDRTRLMFRYWNAGNQDDTYAFSSVNHPILARPFFNTSVSGSFAQDTQLVAFPGDSVGSINVDTMSRVDGLELTLNREFYRDRFTTIDWVYGYQYVGIDEGLTISSNTNVTGALPGLQGSSIAVTDRFETENTFHGMSYGLMSSRRFACWKMEGLVRLGLGNLRRTVRVDGSTTTTSSAGVSNTESQGLLARNTNDQPFEDDTFVVVPEVGLNLACMIRPGLDFTVGYNYLMVPKVAQASQQIGDDLRVNLSDPITGPLDPQRNFDERRYWINSLGLGLQWQY